MTHKNSEVTAVITCIYCQIVARIKINREMWKLQYRVFVIHVGVNKKTVHRNNKIYRTNPLLLAIKNRDSNRKHIQY